jgi:hypothetical protein
VVTAEYRRCVISLRPLASSGGIHRDSTPVHHQLQSMSSAATDCSLWRAAPANWEARSAEVGEANWADLLDNVMASNKLDLLGQASLGGGRSVFPVLRAPGLRVLVVLVDSGGVEGSRLLLRRSPAWLVARQWWLEVRRRSGSGIRTLRHVGVTPVLAGLGPTITRLLPVRRGRERPDASLGHFWRVSSGGQPPRVPAALRRMRVLSHGRSGL